MAIIDEEIARIDAQIAALTKLKDTFDAFEGDVVAFIRAIESGDVQIAENAGPRITASIIVEWEKFRAARA